VTTTPTKERPILFSGPLVRAILAGTKTQTRRPVKPPLAIGWGSPRWHSTETKSGRQVWGWWDRGAPPCNSEDRVCPCGAPGDRLWVRETWASSEPGIVAYRADGAKGAWMGDGGGGRIWAHHGWIQDVYRDGRAAPDGAYYGLGAVGGKWRPSLHMPRWASRLTLEVTDVRVERLKEIALNDVRAEGLDSFSAFAAKWEEIYGAGSFDADPWVWVVSFRRVESER
jgi:hypothetical protein